MADSTTARLTISGSPGPPDGFTIALTEQTAVNNNDFLRVHALPFDVLHERLDELLGDAKFDVMSGASRPLGMCLTAVEQATALCALMAFGMPTAVVSLSRQQIEALSRW